MLESALNKFKNETWKPADISGKGDMGGYKKGSMISIKEWRA